MNCSVNIKQRPKLSSVHYSCAPTLCQTCFHPKPLMHSSASVKHNPKKLICTLRFWFFGQFQLNCQLFAKMWLLLHIATAVLFRLQVAAASHSLTLLLKIIVSVLNITLALQGLRIHPSSTTRSFAACILWDSELCPWKTFHLHFVLRNYGKNSDTIILRAVCSGLIKLLSRLISCVLLKWGKTVLTPLPLSVAESL